MVPPFVNQYDHQLKNTSLLYVVAIPEPHVHRLDHRLRQRSAARVYTSVAIATSSSSIRCPCGRPAWRRALTSSEAMSGSTATAQELRHGRAVRGVSLEVRRGEVVVVIGP